MKCLECNYRSLTNVTLILYTILYLYNTYTHKNTDTSTNCFKVSTPTHSQAVSRSAHRHIHKLFKVSTHAHSQAVSRSAHRHIHKLFQGQHSCTFTSCLKVSTHAFRHSNAHSRTYITHNVHVSYSQV